MACVADGHLCDYAPADLLYADGTRPGRHPPRPAADDVPSRALIWSLALGVSLLLAPVIPLPTHKGTVPLTRCVRA